MRNRLHEFLLGLCYIAAKYFSEALPADVFFQVVVSIFTFLNNYG